MATLHPAKLFQIKQLLDVIWWELRQRDFVHKDAMARPKQAGDLPKVVWAVDEPEALRASLVHQTLSQVRLSQAAVARENQGMGGVLPCQPRLHMRKVSELELFQYVFRLLPPHRVYRQLNQHVQLYTQIARNHVVCSAGMYGFRSEAVDSEVFKAGATELGPIGGTMYVFPIKIEDAGLKL